MKQIWKLLLIFFVFVYCAYTLTTKVQHVPYHPDEISWFFHTEFFDQLFLKKNFSQTFWESYEAYDQPPVSKYIYGILLWTNDKGVSRVRQNLVTQWGRWSLYSNPNLSDIAHSSFVPYITTMRYLNIVFTIGTIIGLFLILTNLQVSWVIALVLPITLTQSNFFVTIMIRATSDPHLIFFMTWGLLAYLLYLKRHTIGYIFLFVLFCGLAVSSKLTGIILVLTYLLFQMSICIDSQKKMAIVKEIAIVCVGIISIWLIVNPTLYHQPLQHSLNYILFRNNQSIRLQQYYRSIAFTNVSEKFTAVFCTLINPNCGNKFEFAYLSHSLILNIVLVLVGLLALQRNLQNNQNKEPSRLLLCYILISFCLIAVYLPLNFDRYFLPLQIIVYMVQVIGINLIVNLIPTCRKFFHLKQG